MRAASARLSLASAAWRQQQHAALSARAWIAGSRASSSSSSSSSDLAGFPVCPKTGLADLSGFTSDRIRSTSISAHIDHGKTTLSACLIPGNTSLDSLQVEQERGITVHSSTASWVHSPPDARQPVLMQLVDTPGHVDFRFEVERAFRAVEGCLMLVDASQGVQAQTIANFWTAFEAGCHIIPVVNKIDLSTANIDETLLQLSDVFGLAPEEALLVSAKSQRGIETILPAVLDRVPPPTGLRDAPLRLLLTESFYDRHKGVVLVVRLMDGSVRAGDEVTSKHTGLSYKVAEVGVLTGSERREATALFAGQVGYMCCNMRQVTDSFPGDTFVDTDATPALPGFDIPKPVVFSGIYASTQDETQEFVEAMEKYALTDSSLTMVKESNAALGTGYRCGFHGVLHLEVFIQRLKQEHGIECVATMPNVPYIVDGKLVETASEFPELPQTVEEPYVESIIVVPSQFLGPTLELCHARRGTMKNLEYLGTTSKLAVLTFEMPAAATVTGFVEALKALSSGYASYEYKPIGYRKGDIVKVSILLNGVDAAPLATLCDRKDARAVALDITARLKEVIRRHMFEIIIQGALNKKILCRERIPPFRKDVTAKLYGGDPTRRRKLLEKQKRGKKKMRTIGNVELSPEAFFAVATKKG